MAYYNICQLCGATLDPGERCDCAKHNTKGFEGGGLSAKKMDGNNNE